MKRVESLVKVSPSDSTLALCLRIICTGENAADKSRFPVTDGLSGARCGGIHYLYDGPLGRPEESCWDGKGGTVSIISALLFIPSGSAAAVRKVLTDCQTARLALDSHGFADLDAAVAFQCALASADTSAAGAALRAKWNMGSVGVLWACMEMTWMEVAPSSERVIEDVDRMLVVLDKIIAAGGCVVSDEFLRTGRRAMRADGTKALGGKARKRQRIETLEARPHHPELNGAYALLVNAEHAQSHTFH